MQQETRHRKEKVSPAFFDLQIITRTQLLLDRDSIVKYIVRAMCHYNDNEMLVIPYNTGNY
jgi:hypothetical protein